jgi:hypothetical protein
VNGHDLYIIIPFIILITEIYFVFQFPWESNCSLKLQRATPETFFLPRQQKATPAFAGMDEYAND